WRNSSPRRPAAWLPWPAGSSATPNPSCAWTDAAPTATPCPCAPSRTGCSSSASTAPASARTGCAGAATNTGPPATNGGSPSGTSWPPTWRPRDVLPAPPVRRVRPHHHHHPGDPVIEDVQLTLHQAAAEARVKPQTIETWIHRGYLKPIPGTRPRRFRLAD